MSLCPIIASLPAEPDRDLMLCREFGIAYQADRGHLVAYDEPYYSKCLSYEDQEIARKINAGRIALVEKFVGFGKVIDVGIGSGEFIKKRNALGHPTFGCDVNPVAIEWLKRNDLWAERLGEFCGATFWDVIEHVPNPGAYLKQIQLHAFAFFSLPIYERLEDIFASKHYRPGEHLQHFTDPGFVWWMEAQGFMLLDRQAFETDAGREKIASYAFKRYKWPKETASWV